MFSRQPRVVVIGGRGLALESLLDLDSVYAASFSPAATIKIERVLPEDPVVVGAPNAHAVRRAGVCFSLNLQGLVAKDAAEAASKLVASTIGDQPPLGWRDIDRHTRSILVSRIIFDDLTRFATFCVLSAALCSDEALNVDYMIDDFAPKRRGLYRRFRIHSPKASALIGGPLPSLRETIDFITRQAQGAAMSPFMRGLGYFTRSLEHGIRDDASRLIWAVAATEALLTKRKEQGTGLLENRLAAILDDTNGIVKGKFRSLYKFRSDYVHGSLDVPIIIADDHVMPNVASPSFVLGEQERAGMAHDIARSVLRKMVILNREQLEFVTHIS